MPRIDVVDLAADAMRALGYLVEKMGVRVVIYPDGRRVFITRRGG